MLAAEHPVHKHEEAAKIAQAIKVNQHNALWLTPDGKPSTQYETLIAKLSADNMTPVDLAAVRGAYRGDQRSGGARSGGARSGPDAQRVAQAVAIAPPHLAMQGLASGPSVARLPRCPARADRCPVRADRVSVSVRVCPCSSTRSSSRRRRCGYIYSRILYSTVNLLPDGTVGSYPKKVHDSAILYGTV